jgi:hypothetical protein
MSEIYILSWHALKWNGRPQFAGGITTRLEDNPKILEAAWKRIGGLSSGSQDHSNARENF